MPKVLIPLYSTKQLTKDFLLDATAKAKTVILLEVIDPASGLTATELTSKMRELEPVIEELKFELAKRGVKTLFLEEWGSWEEKIANTCKRERVDEVVMPAIWKLDVKGVNVRRIRL